MDQQQSLMFTDEEMGVSPSEPVAAPKRVHPVEKRARDASERDFASRQLGFGDDIMGVITVVEIAEGAQAQVDAALSANPDILPSVADHPEARENLGFARFMRAAGVPEAEVQNSLEVAGINAGEVMAQLAQVEAAIGADYPSEMVVDLAMDAADDLPEEEDDDEELADDEFVAEDEVLDVGEEEVGPVEAAARKARSESSSTALGAFLKSIRGPRHEPLTIEQENALAERIKAGDIEANKELAEHNMRFLVFMAKRFRYTGRTLDELISAGTTGLITATKKFDPTRGRFTTCAQHWIRQSIQRATLADGLMKVPAYMPARESKLRKQAVGATTTAERDELLAKADALKREIAARRATHVSLDGGSDDDSDSGAGLHNIFATVEDGVDDKLESARLVEWLQRAARVELKTQEGKADDRARDVFLLRIGLHERHYGEPQTLAEVAAVFNISRERVRQIFTEAAQEVVTAVEHYARGPQNLPNGFREGLLSMGRRSGEARDEGEAAMEAIFEAECAGPGESEKRTQLAAWLVQAANRELKTLEGKPDAVSRDVFLMRIGLHKAHYGQPQSVAQVGRHLGLKRVEVAKLYDEAAEEVAYAVEHYAKTSDNLLPQSFRRSLMGPGR